MLIVRKVVITLKSLFYNSHCTCNYAVDTLLEPIFWFIDNYVHYFGPVNSCCPHTRAHDGQIFIALLMALIVSIVGLMYMVVLPYEILVHKSTVETVLYLVFGNYVLVNGVFHCVMALCTGPGRPPSVSMSRT
jgi:palmitoyltransferase